MPRVVLIDRGNNVEYIYDSDLDDEYSDDLDKPIKLSPHVPILNGAPDYQDETEENACLIQRVPEQ